MHGKPIRIVLWMLGILVCTALYVNAALLPLPSGGPWLALIGILMLLAAIALGARRHLSFGGRV
jgi:LPXTG-motif cell wall-anchored protein